MSKITFEQTDADFYAEHSGNVCPVCRSSVELSSEGGFDASDLDAWRTINCLKCGAEIQEDFIMTGITVEGQSFQFKRPNVSLVIDELEDENRIGVLLTPDWNDELQVYGEGVVIYRTDELDMLTKNDILDLRINASRLLVKWGASGLHILANLEDYEIEPDRG